MPEDIETLIMSQTPTAERPLLGLTVLMVEDSRFASEAIRLLCLRSGARIRRADSLKSARRHLRVYRPSVVIIDLGLPDGSGAALIRELANAIPRLGIIFGISGNDGGVEHALEAGADGFFAKPIESLATFQRAILEHLPADAQPKGLHTLTNDKISPDPIALHDDLIHISSVLKSDANDGQAIDYVAQFLTGIARIAHDDVLESAVIDLAKQRAKGQPTGPQVAQISGMVQERLGHRRVV